MSWTVDATASMIARQVKERDEKIEELEGKVKELHDKALRTDQWMLELEIRLNALNK